MPLCTADIVRTTQCKNIVEMENRLRGIGQIDASLLLQAKKLGFSDRRIGICLSKSEDEVRGMHKQPPLPYTRSG